MPLQHFYQSPSATQMARFTDGRIGGEAGYEARLLNDIFYVANSDMILGSFVTTPRDLGILVAVIVRYQFQKLWRDGRIVDIGSALPQIGFTGSRAAVGAYNPTRDGRVARTPQLGGGFGAEQMATVIGDPASQGSSNITFNIWDFDAGSTLAFNVYQNYYIVDPLWPGNMIVPGAVMDSQLLGKSQKGLIDVAAKTGFALELSGGGANFSVASHTALDGSYTSTLVIPAITTDASYRQPKNIIPIDGSTVAILFGNFATDQNSPAILRVYDTAQNVGTWTLLWEDELPSSDGAATYDPTRGVLYSINKHASAAFLNASWLKRRPMQVAVPTIVGGATELIPLDGQTLQTKIVHGSGGVTGHTSLTSFLSAELVQWTLDSANSQGSMVSAYSLTDSFGSSTITYFGPALPSNLTERVNATVAEVWRG